MASKSAAVFSMRREWITSKVVPFTPQEAINHIQLGKRLLESIVEGKKWPKSLPKITDEIVAIEVAKLLLQAQFFHRSEKVEGKKGYLKVCFSSSCISLNLSS